MSPRAAGWKMDDATKAKIGAGRTSEERSRDQQHRDDLAWPPTTAAELERFWVQRDHRYVLRKRPLTEQERAAIFAARRFDVDRLGGLEQSKAWRMLSCWVLPHI